MGETASGSRAGSRIGRYLLKRLLGHGTTGEVYEAVDTVTEQTLALKLLAPELGDDPAFREAMQEEAYVVTRLRGPHIVPVNDFGEADGNLFIEMPLIAGTDLSELMTTEGPLTPSRAVNIVRQAASALDTAHALGILHGNVKPSNILVSADDVVHLTDFGFSMGGADPDQRWKYSAPELFAEGELDPSIDVYALTGVLYQCLTGSAPYRGDTIEALATAHQTQPIPRPSQLNPSIPASFDTVIAKGMAKRPHERYASAGALDVAAYQALSSPGESQPASSGAGADPTSVPPVAATTPQSATPPDPQGRPPAAPSQQASAPDLQSTPPAAPTEQLAPVPAEGEQAPHVPPLQPTPPAVAAPLPHRSPPAAAGWDPRASHYTAGAPPKSAPTRPAADTAWRDYSLGPARRGSHPWDRKQLMRIGAALAAVLGLIVWLTNRSHEDESAADNQAAESTAAETSQARTQSDEAQARLLKLVPVGYAPNTCKPTDPLGGAVAEVSCGKSVDIDGPQSAKYTLYSDLGALRLSFDTAVQTSSVVTCPGRIQSPGAWHRTTSPDKSSGMLLCALRQGTPTLVWTNDADLFVGFIQMDRPGAGFEQLYAWWSSHS